MTWPASPCEKPLPALSQTGSHRLGPGAASDASIRHLKRRRLLSLNLTVPSIKSQLIKY